MYCNYNYQRKTIFVFSTALRCRRRYLPFPGFQRIKFSVCVCLSFKTKKVQEKLFSGAIGLDLWDKFFTEGYLYLTMLRITHPSKYQFCLEQIFELMAEVVYISVQATKTFTIKVALTHFWTTLYQFNPAKNKIDVCITNFPIQTEFREGNLCHSRSNIANSEVSSPSLFHFMSCFLQIKLFHSI